MADTAGTAGSPGTAGTARTPEAPRATPASPAPALEELTARHRDLLDRAVEAVAARAFWSPYPEHPKAYGEQAAAEGKAAFEALLGAEFALPGHPGRDGTVGPAPADGGERSPFGPELGIAYPHADPDSVLPAMRAALPGWRAAGPVARAAVCAEVLARINARTHEFAHAVMHTSGQAYLMAFQAGGTHAQDRGLEAVALALAEQTRLPARAEWSKPQGKRPALELVKEFTPVGLGVALLVGCNTFPTWNGYPGLFASLATGNAVLVKPHPRAVLPLALTVRTAREVLDEAGLDPNLVCLAPEYPDERSAAGLAVRPEVRIVDYTGGSAFGEWLEANARQAQVFTEKAGVNTVLVDSTDDYRGMLGNLAFSLSLYSGQMCTTPQNLLVPRGGIATDQGQRSVDEFAADLSAAVGKLLGDDARAVALLGALVNPEVRARLEHAATEGRTVLASREVVHPEFPDAVVRTPAVLAADAAAEPGKPDERPAWLRECFGPVSYLVAVDSTADAVHLLRRTVREYGAMTVGAYSVSESVLGAVREACLDSGAALSENLTGGVYVNQTAAFSDLHGTGANPASSAALSDAGFVTPRFRTVEIRRPAVS